jgi:hypothetical protein
MEMLSQNRYRFVTPWEEAANVRKLQSFGLGQVKVRLKKKKAGRTGNARQAFLKWLQQRHPNLTAQILARAQAIAKKPGVTAASGLGQIPPATDLEGLGAGFFTDLWDSIKSVGTTIIAGGVKNAAEQTLINQQMQRAQQGYMPYPVPPTAPPQNIPVPGLPAWVMPVGLGVGALALVLILKKKK